MLKSKAGGTLGHLWWDRSESLRDKDEILPHVEVRPRRSVRRANDEPEKGELVQEFPDQLPLHWGQASPAPAFQKPF